VNVNSFKYVSAKSKPLSNSLPYVPFGWSAPGGNQTETNETYIVALDETISIKKFSSRSPLLLKQYKE